MNESLLPMASQSREIRALAEAGAGAMVPWLGLRLRQREVETLDVFLTWAEKGLTDMGSVRIGPLFQTHPHVSI